MPLPDLKALTPREREVLILVADGKSLMEIAEELHRSLKTVESHRLSLGKKLNAGNRVELAKIAIAHGLVSLPEPAIKGSDQEEAPAGDIASMDDDALVELWKRSIEARVYDKAGPNYLNELACAICDAVGIKHAGVSCLGQGTQENEIVCSLAYAKQGKIADQFSYDLDKTPCEAAIQQGYYQVDDSVCELFPDDRPLAATGATFYAGIALNSPGGQPVGVLWVVDPQRQDRAESIQALLHYFAPRVAPVVVEIGRVEAMLKACEEHADRVEQANEDMRLINERLDQIADFYGKLAERMSDGLAVLNRQFQFIYVNKKYTEIVGVPRDELLGQSIDVVLTEKSRADFHARQPQRETDVMRHYEAVFQRPDGEHRRAIVAPRTLLDDHGAFAGSFAVVTDLADVEHVEEFVKEKTQA